MHCGDRGVPLYGPSGASEHLRGVVRALVRAGHDVRVAVIVEADRRGRWGRTVDAPVFVAPPRRWPRGLRTWGTQWSARVTVARALADGWRPHWGWERHALASGRSAAPGVRWLVEVNAPVVAERRAVGAKVRPAVARDTLARLREADRVIVVSTWLANWAVAQGVPGHRVRVVPNGVESGLPSDRATARAGGPEGLVVGFVGSFKRAQGVHRLLPILDALGPDAWLVTVGTGPERLAPHPRHVARGQVAPERVAEAIAGFHVGLAPYEASAPPWFCPLKVLAYRAQGVPVVCGPVPEAARLVGEGGEVVATMELEAWAAAIRRQAGRRLTPWVRTWDNVVIEALAP